MSNNELIYGKNRTNNIVSIEVEGDTVTLFIEKDGIVSQEKHPHRFWLLSNERLDLSWVKMNGDQHYKFGKQFDSYFKLKNEKDRFQGKDFYNISNATEACQVKDGYSYFKGMQPNEVSILAFDIETNGFALDENSRVVLIANTLRKNGEVIRKLFSHDEYENDGEMIEDWCNWVLSVDPSIMCGHNIYTFDLPFLVHTAGLYNKKLRLGRNEAPIRIQNIESNFRVDGSRDLHYHKIQIYGREICDTMFLSYKYDIGRKYESYGLKYIINKEGLEKEGRTFYDAQKIKDNFNNPEEMDKIKKYAEEDGDDALALFDLMVPPFFYMTQMIPKPFQLIIESASGSQLNSLMVRSYLQNKHSIPKASEAIEFEGAISFGEAGIYPNAVSLDIASLYPSVMLQYDVHDPIKDPENNMLKLLTYLRDERLKNKKLAKETGLDKYKHLDGSFKILINSLYGFLGATGLNYNYPKGAAEVTRKGREILTQSMTWAKSKGFTVPKGDTDSITIYKDGQPFETPEINSLIDEVNSILPPYINFELDAVYDVIVVFKAKNYAYREGTKISLKGSSIKGGTKSAALKEFQRKVIDILLEGSNEDINDRLKVVYNDFVIRSQNLKTMEDIKQWATRKTLSSTMVESTRPNETKIIEAIKGTNYKEGDRFFTFYRSDDSVCLVENFEEDYNKVRLLKAIHDTITIFGDVLNIKDHFLNYALKKNQKLLENL